MEWKRQIRHALRDRGHRATEIIRKSQDAPKDKTPLSQHPNEYAGGCRYCGLRFTVKTEPGEDARIQIVGYPQMTIKKLADAEINFCGIRELRSKRKLEAPSVQD